MDQFTRRLVGIGVQCGAITTVDVCRMFTPPFMGRVSLECVRLESQRITGAAKLWTAVSLPAQPSNSLWSAAYGKSSRRLPTWLIACGKSGWPPVFGDRKARSMKRSFP
jgi:hypothetical protein